MGAAVAKRWAGRVLRRLAGAVFVVWAVVTLCFFAVRAITADPVQAVLGGAGSNATSEAIDDARARYGLDQPLFVQYLLQLGSIARLDFGRSYVQKTDVGALLGANIGGTLSLAAWSLVVAWVLALAVAAWSVRGGAIARGLGSALEIGASAMPHFWLASILILVFSTGLGWLPSIAVPGPSGAVLPIITLAVPIAGFLGQVMRESLLDAFSAPFALSARLRGESESGVLWRHALRHAAIPAIGVTGWAFGYLISGAVVVETVFARPGLGRLLLGAVQLRDMPVIIAVVVVIAAVYVVVLAVSDLVVAAIDPRTRAAVST